MIYYNIKRLRHKDLSGFPLFIFHEKVWENNFGSKKYKIFKKQAKKVEKLKLSNSQDSKFTLFLNKIN